MRAYRVSDALAQRSVAEIERSFAPDRVFVQRVRRDTELLAGAPDLVLRAGDVAVFGARRRVLLGPGSHPRAKRSRTGSCSISPWPRWTWS